MMTTRRIPAGTGRPPLAAVQRQLFVCAECQHAQLFTVQPRALCTRRGAALEGAAVFAGQPACPHMTPRRGVEPLMAQCATGGEGTSRRSGRATGT